MPVEVGERGFLRPGLAACQALLTVQLGLFDGQVGWGRFMAVHGRVVLDVDELAAEGILPDDEADFGGESKERGLKLVARRSACLHVVGAS